ncbi:MAG: hypothetical protein GXY55_06925 [Phycisphaerae bacterium]|nr:hypothetical protein [Phycisphaerae bacterium]
MSGRYVVSTRGFTLLEAILALSLTILLMSGVFAFYMTVMQARDEGSRATRDAKLNRAVLDRIADEIRHATDIVPGDGIGFSGDERKITIIRLAMPERYAFDEYDSQRDTLPPAQLDLRRITYQLIWDEELVDDEGVKLCHGLWRTEQRTFDPNPQFVVQDDETPGMQDEEDPEQSMVPQAEGELVAPEIKYIDFRYFDGADWRDRWQYTAEATEGESAGTEAAAETGDLGGLTDLLGGAAAGKQGSTVPKGPNDQGYVMPQAVRITIGRTRVPPEEDELDLEKLRLTEERREEETYYNDRFSIVVPIMQADQTLLSSRKYGVADSMSRQEGGQ